MTVTAIGNSVEFSHGGKTFKVPCKNEDEVKQVKDQLEKAEQQLLTEEEKLGVTPEQLMAAVDQQSGLSKAPPPPGVGENLKTVA